MEKKSSGTQKNGEKDKKKCISHSSQWYQYVYKEKDACRANKLKGKTGYKNQTNLHLCKVST